MTTATQAPPGVIECGATYTLAEFRARAGWGRDQMRLARQAGLRCIKIGVRKYVRGDDFHEWLGTQG